MMIAKTTRRGYAQTPVPPTRLGPRPLPEFRTGVSGAGAARGSGPAADLCSIRLHLALT